MILKGEALIEATRKKGYAFEGAYATHLRCCALDLSCYDILAVGEKLAAGDLHLTYLQGADKKGLSLNERMWIFSVVNKGFGLCVRPKQWLIDMQRAAQGEAQ